MTGNQQFIVLLWGIFFAALAVDSIADALGGCSP